MSRSLAPAAVSVFEFVRAEEDGGRAEPREVGTMDELTRGNRSTLRWLARRRHLAVPTRWPGDSEEATGDVSDVMRDRGKWKNLLFSLQRCVLVIIAFLRLTWTCRIIESIKMGPNIKNTKLLL
ncbi:hypothetical protein GUJ93_ZPchr0012g20623 [Zizania palustris]|uniref:Uncharacterized protein n=1 Tax=Zizania palustris TaxID=103762 RepID=A0A8J5WQ27_ZIZPA|nr:hypothetical protein GUJ93_ZPchr0012g20623 [Zizania palustris]